MKKLAVLASLGMALSLSASAGVIDLKGIKTGRYCEGQTVDIDLAQGGEYVERMLVSAAGVGRDGFIKVMADNEVIHNIGVPGYDPDYSFRVRRHTKRITLKFERTCIDVQDIQIVTPTTPPAQYPRYSLTAVQGDTWGDQVLAITKGLSIDLINEPDFYSALWPDVLLPLKKAALYQGASEKGRDSVRSTVTGLRSLRIAAVIQKNHKFLDGLLDDYRFDYVVMDLLRIQEDILDRHDVKPKDLDARIAELEAALEQAE